MSFLSFKQAFRNTGSRIGNRISSGFTFLRLLLTFFAVGAIASLFIPQIVMAFGMYSCLVGGAASALAFVTMNTIFNLLSNQFKSWFGKKTLTKQELDELKMEKATAIKNIDDAEKKELAAINKKIAKDIKQLEIEVFDRDVPHNFLTRTISRQWNKRDQGVIDSYLEMQKEYLELEREAARQSYLEIRQGIEKEFARIKDNAEQENIKAIQLRTKDLIDKAMKEKDLRLGNMRRDFKTTASDKHSALKSRLLHKDLYGMQKKGATKIDSAMIRKMLINGRCPLVSGCDEYKVFWRDTDEYNAEYEKYKADFSSAFPKSAANQTSQEDSAKPSALRKIKNFFSKNKTKNIATPTTSIQDPCAEAINRMSEQQNPQAPCPYHVIQTTQEATPLKPHSEAGNQKINMPCPSCA